jgi:hypothetical protein
MPVLPGVTRDFRLQPVLPAEEGVSGENLVCRAQAQAEACGYVLD